MGVLSRRAEGRRRGISDRSRSVAAHGAAGGVLVTDDGVAAPPVDYEFDGFAGVDAEYNALRPPFEESLTPNLPRGLNLARQIFYVERTFPKVFAAARAFLVGPQHLVLAALGRHGLRKLPRSPCIPTFGGRWKGAC